MIIEISGFPPLEFLISLISSSYVSLSPISSLLVQLSLFVTYLINQESHVISFYFAQQTFKHVAGNLSVAATETGAIFEVLKPMMETENLRNEWFKSKP